MKDVLSIRIGTDLKDKLDRMAKATRPALAD
jgi:predicted transcriptional regulator